MMFFNCMFFKLYNITFNVVDVELIETCEGLKNNIYNRIIWRLYAS